MSNPSLSLLQGDPTTWGIPPVGKTFVGINQAGQFVLVQNNGAIVPIVSTSPGLSNQANSSGTTTISAAAAIHTAVLVITGTARTVPVVISAVGAVQGFAMDVLIMFPATAGIALDLRDTNSGGVQLDHFTTDGSILTGMWRLYFDGSNWQKKQVQVPAY